MKLHLPLYVRILALFVLNVVIVGGLLFVVFRLQFRFGLDSFLAGHANRNVQALAQVIGSELRSTPEEEWDQVLQPFSEAYGVSLFLFRPDGLQLAGEAVALPREVRQQLRMLGGGLGGARGRPLERNLLSPGQRMSPDGPPRPSGDLTPGEGPRFGEPGFRRRLGQRRVDGEPVGRPGRFFRRTGDPASYWAGVFLPPTGPVPRFAPLVLVIRSTSLSGGGLFFDVKPWIAAGFGALLVSALLWIPFVRSITRTVSQMNRVTEQIAVGRFDSRVDAGRRDELGDLAGAINRMAERLEGFVKGQKRFLGDIAHELCSPLARTQTALGILEQRGTADREYVKDLQEEAEHMSGLVGELLAFSKASLGSPGAQLESVNLREVIDQAIQREARDGVEIQVKVPQSLTVLAKAELLQRAVANLLRNAVRYAGQAGPIDLDVRMEDPEVVLTVADHGPGVPAESLPKLFDPFYRVDSSRTRETGGVGMGLAIVKTCVESCNGTVTCENRRTSGLEFTIRLKAGNGSSEPRTGAPVGKAAGD